MTELRPTTAIRELGALFSTGGAAGLTDAQLLEKYRDRRAEMAGVAAEAEAAFAALVARHGPMVWGVCRQTVGDRHAAEDAFQATFLILAQRAGTVRVEGSLGRWLYGVSRRVAGRVRADRRRRSDRERRAAVGEAVPDTRSAEMADERAAVNEELARLPERYRAPVVLCHLGGKSYATAADELGCSIGTVKRRLAKARALLRIRLTRRGVSLSAGAVGALLTAEADAVPLSLTRSTVRNASALARSMVNGRVEFLVVEMVAATRMAYGVKVLSLAALLMAGAWFFAGRGPAGGVTAAPESDVGQGVAVAEEDGQAPATAIATTLPDRAELGRLLRLAAARAAALAQEKARPRSETLASLAKAQALGGDRPGATETFRVAVREAGGEFGGKPDARALWLLARVQAEVGFKDDAARTLQHALEVLPGVVGDLSDDDWTAMILTNIVVEQSRLGRRDEARRTADRLQAFAREVIKGSKDTASGAIVAMQVTRALASVDDFDGAFRNADAASDRASALGDIAVVAADCLDAQSARRYMAEVSKRADELTPPDQRGFLEMQLMQAWALVGDFSRAKRLARTAYHKSQDDDDGRGRERLYAMIRIAQVQRYRGDLQGARATLREGRELFAERPPRRERDNLLYRTAQAQADAGDFEGALRTVETMPELNKSRILALVARARAVAGDVANAKEPMQRALAQARDTAAHSVTFAADAALAEIQSMAGDPKGAFRTLKPAGDELYRESGIAGIVSARAAAGDVAGALRLAIEEPLAGEERRAALKGLGEGVAARVALDELLKASK